MVYLVIYCLWGLWLYSSAQTINFPFKTPSIPPDTIDSINVPSYLGRWYQLYASQIPNATFEKNGYCVTADYFSMKTACMKDIAFGVSNTMR